MYFFIYRVIARIGVFSNIQGDPQAFRKYIGTEFGVFVKASKFTEIVAVIKRSIPNPGDPIWNPYNC